MATTINSNGSKWAGEPPDPIDALFERLRVNTLSRVHSPFIYGAQRDADYVMFAGNFLDISAVFSIETDDQDLIERLSRAIRSNMQRPEYLEQPKPRER